MSVFKSWRISTSPYLRWVTVTPPKVTSPPTKPKPAALEAKICCPRSLPGFTLPVWAMVESQAGRGFPMGTHRPSYSHRPALASCPLCRGKGGEIPVKPISPCWGNAGGAPTAFISRLLRSLLHLNALLALPRRLG